MKEIKLSQGKVTLVDDEDYVYLVQFNWSASKPGGSKYYRAVRMNKNKLEFMHRVIMNTPDGLFVDHIDHDSLNNQKYNLRNCTKSENNQNKSSNKKYQGIYWDKANSKYKAQIMINYRQISLGRYSTAEEAALAYNKAAIEYYGSGAKINIVSNPV